MTWFSSLLFSLHFRFHLFRKPSPGDRFQPLFRYLLTSCFANPKGPSLDPPQRLIDFKNLILVAGKLPELLAGIVLIRPAIRHISIMIRFLR